MEPGTYISNDEFSVEIDKAELLNAELEADLEIKQQMLK